MKHKIDKRNIIITLSVWIAVFIFLYLSFIKTEEIYSWVGIGLFCVAIAFTIKDMEL